MSSNIGYCGYSYHTKPYIQDRLQLQNYLFRLQTDGTCVAVVNEKSSIIKKGDLLLVKPGDQYELLIEEGHSGDYHLFCDGKWVDEWWSRNPKPTLSKIDLNEKLTNLWEQIIFEERRPLSTKNDELSNYLLKALCLSLERSANETSPTFSYPYVVSRMMRYIEEHATSIFKIDEVANFSGLSVSRAVHLFKTHVGKTMIEYALEIRLSSAINQMKFTSMTLEQIAENCGFGAYSYFHRVFKKKIGIAPGSYRNQL